MSLRELGELLGGGEPRSVEDVLRIAANGLARVERDLDALAAQRERLRRLVQTCGTGSDDDCLELTPSGVMPA